MRDHRESLLHKIKRLYMELFLVGLHNRLDQFHAPLHSEKSHEISGALHGIIDEIVIEVSHNYTVADYKKMQASGSVEADDKGRTGGYYRSPSSLASMTGNSLSLYLKKHQTEENDMHMSDKLQKVVWDHVHSSHRFARTGDAGTAKLHANIASNVMKTLSYYMLEDSYYEFHDVVASELDNMSNNTKKNKNKSNDENPESMGVH